MRNRKKSRLDERAIEAGGYVGPYLVSDNLNNDRCSAVTRARGREDRCGGVNGDGKEQ